MIDLTRMKQRRTKGRIAIELLLNAPQLLLIVYGLKCIVTLQGKMLLGVRGALRGTLHVVPVDGTAASTVGWLYVGFGLFVYLSDGSPPAEDRAWPWRLGRGLARWGSLALALICFVEAENRVSGRSVSLDGIAPHLLMKMGVFIAGFIALSFYLSAMFQREQVKRELADRGCQARRIWWLPAAYWVPWASFWGATGFRVSYADPVGVIH